MLEEEGKGEQTGSWKHSYSKGRILLQVAAHEIAIMYCFQFLVGFCAQKNRLTGRNEKKNHTRQQGHDIEQPQETTSDGKDRAGREAFERPIYPISG